MEIIFLMNDRSSCSEDEWQGANVTRTSAADAAIHFTVTFTIRSSSSDQKETISAYKLAGRKERCQRRRYRAIAS